MQQHGSRYFACRPTSSPDYIHGVGSKGKNSTFSEHGHVAYQIKGNPSSNMETDPLTQIQLFLNMVMLHIKLKGILAATWKQTP